jgi:hypothetical protein
MSTLDTLFKPLVDEKAFDLLNIILVHYATLGIEQKEQRENNAVAF